MTDTSQPPEPDRPSINLKLPQAPVSHDQPWNDDLLDRQQLATTLTNLLRTQSHPFTISIHGYWGTGKTFLLQRWQQDLHSQEFPAIYFNAWEDDFCDDPLIAILGQLDEYFRQPRLSRLRDTAVESAIPALRQTAQTVLKATTGLTVDLNQSESPTLLDAYREQRRAKDQLKEALTRLSKAAYAATGYPLVFIIDELDRCRPTFAIELLEKVKHIFDIEHMVFVFGINRNELARSLHSIYGNIDSDVYLRRFFDIEFTLPEIDAAMYCRHMMDKFRLQDIFLDLTSEANNNVHAEEYRSIRDTFPEIWSRFGLSLRDIEHCVASIALVAKNVAKGSYMFPIVLGLLIPIKLKNQALYYGFIQHKSLASEVINYADEFFSSAQVTGIESQGFDFVEAHLYFAESVSVPSPHGTPSALDQLKALAGGDDPANPESVSTRVKAADQARIAQMLRTIEAVSHHYWNAGDIIRYIASLIDLHRRVLRR